MHRNVRTALACGVLAALSLPGAGQAGVSCVILSCPSLVYPADPGSCAATIDYPLPPSSTLACGPVQCDIPPNSLFALGPTIVTCHLDNVCAFTITVQDTQPPAIACPADMSVLGVPPQAVSFPAPSASDNCPAVTSTCTPPSGSPFTADPTTVSCNATDGSGNVATAPCTFSVGFQGIASVPTLSWWGLGALVVLLVACGGALLRRALL
jgi:hypothetical protein